MRGTTNTNVRGSAESRRRRKQALLNRDGDGTTAPCWECATPVTARTMVADRVVPGCRGGTYRLGNLRVHCSPCSEAQGRRMSAESRRWACWQRRGLRRSRLSEGGVTMGTCWFVYLDGRQVGYVEPWPRALGGGWRAFLDPGWRLAGTGRTLREATYALLVEHAKPKSLKQAA